MGAKRPLIESLSEMNEFLVYQQSVEQSQNRRIQIEYKDALEFYQSDTFDGPLLDIYQTLFSGNFEKAQQMFDNFEIGSYNTVESLRYFAYFLSNFIEGVPNPYNASDVSLEDLAFNSKKDQDIRKFKKPDYLTLMQFWMVNTPRKLEDE